MSRLGTSHNKNVTLHRNPALIAFHQFQSSTRNQHAKKNKNKIVQNTVYSTAGLRGPKLKTIIQLALHHLQLSDFIHGPRPQAQNR